MSYAWSLLRTQIMCWSSREDDILTAFETSETIIVQM